MMKDLRLTQGRVSVLVVCFGVAALSGERLAVYARRVDPRIE
jgi:hypothetical protein